MSAQKAKKSLRMPNNFIINLKFGTTACACHRQVASLRSARQAHAVTQTKKAERKARAKRSFALNRLRNLPLFRSLVFFPDIALFFCDTLLCMLFSEHCFSWAYCHIVLGKINGYKSFNYGSLDRFDHIKNPNSEGNRFRTRIRLFGVPGGNRTHGLSLRRRTLYPTELRKHIQRRFGAVICAEGLKILPFRPAFRA